MNQTSRIAAISLLAMISSATTAQIPQPAATAAPKPALGDIASHPGWPVANPGDVKSVDAIVSALYNVISGPKGQARDWNRMRSLFLPSARLIPARVIPSASRGNPTRTDALLLSIDDYIARSSTTMTTSGFFERSIHNEVQQFGNIVHVWSTYESRHTAADTTPFARGINSIQLLKDCDRYWIVNIFWDSERPDNPIPEKYLGR